MIHVDLADDEEPTEVLTKTLLSKVSQLTDEIIKHLKSGLKLLSHARIARRHDICKQNTCGYWQEVRCGHCKCNINSTRWVFNKAALPLASCPLPVPLWGPEADSGR